MKKEPLFYGFLSVIFCVMAFVQCAPEGDGGKNGNSSKKPAVPIETISTASSLDTFALAMDTSGVKESYIADKPAALNLEPSTKAPTDEHPKAAVKAISSKSKPTPKTPPIAAPKVKSAEFSIKSAKAVVHGTSSLHDWESKVTKMEGKGAFKTKDNELVSIKDVEIKIAVKGIKSKEGKKMDDKTYETFKSDKNPYIIYTFSNAAVKVDASHAVTIEASGQLDMAGSTQPVSLLASGIELPNGDMQLSVSKKLKMTDFNMKPPVMMLGTIKVGDEITVKFDFVLEKTK